MFKVYREHDGLTAVMGADTSKPSVLGPGYHSFRYRSDAEALVAELVGLNPLITYEVRSVRPIDIIDVVMNNKVVVSLGIEEEATDAS